MKKNAGWFKVGHKPLFDPTKHGHYGTPTYISWAQMKSRCLNPKNIGWHRYGGRGIQVCERWKSFENFLADMGTKPRGASLERVNNDGHYEPSNCRWATKREQALNRRSTHWLEHNGKRMSIRGWALEIGISEDALGQRIKAGWSLDRALTRRDYRRG